MNDILFIHALLLEMNQFLFGSLNKQLLPWLLEALIFKNNFRLVLHTDGTYFTVRKVDKFLLTQSSERNIPVTLLAGLNVLGTCSTPNFMSLRQFILVLKTNQYKKLKPSLLN
jgi:hypothetical protein